MAILNAAGIGPPAWVCGFYASAGLRELAFNMLWFVGREVAGFFFSF